MSMFTWRHLGLYSVAFRTPDERQTQCKIITHFCWDFQYITISISLPTVPARVRLWFLKPSRHVSKGNPLEDVHVTAEAKTNVLALHHASFGVHHPELQIRSTKKCMKINLCGSPLFVVTIHYVFEIITDLWKR